MADQNIQVPDNTGLIDSVQAAARYIVVLIGFTTAVLGLMRTHDLAGVIALIQTNGGEVLAAISGLIALGTAAYGILKTHKRGSQLNQVAVNPSATVTLK